MATLQEILEASHPKGAFAGRVQGAFIKAAWTVLYEDEQTTDHAQRLAFAKQVLVDPRKYVDRYYRVILSEGTIRAGLADLSAVDDAAVENAVNGFWTIIANLEG